MNLIQQQRKGAETQRNNHPLTGKVALITGAGRGIGKAIALAYAEAGAAICCAARSADELNAVVREIQASGGVAMASVTDVTDEVAVLRMLQETASELGGLDILVINAGGAFEQATVEESDLDHWRKTMDLNLFGAYYCARAAIPYLKQRGAGKIITVGSGLGHKGLAGGSAYACAKAALWMFTRVLAQELAADRISVNELIPGPVDTGLMTDDFRTRVVEKEGEWLKVSEDVAPLALFLATQPDIGPTAQSFSLMRRDT